MKTFDIPHFYRSPIISRVKAIRSNTDKRKKDFSPTRLKFDGIDFILARHFGFCFGVENAIEISYKALDENPDKKIYLLSEMIHNPGVNGDLLRKGITFIQDTKGYQIIPWNQINSNDIVIIPAFGTTIEIETKLKEIGVSLKAYDTTCPFVERVWKKSEKLGNDDYTVIIHGKDQHEETRATFSHSSKYAKSIIIRDIEEARILADLILEKRPAEEFDIHFKNRFSEGFDFKRDLTRIGVVNQTTMLAAETQEISDFLASVMEEKFGVENRDQHFANTRDTLCYATNDNQTATLSLMETEADIAFVVGGYNSSNTSHLVELCEQKFTTYFIQDEEELLSDTEIQHFNLHTHSLEKTLNYLPEKRPLQVIITSGASCPDATVDRVIQQIAKFAGIKLDVEAALTVLKENFNEGI